jgi:periplasmic protein TonB
MSEADSAGPRPRSSRIFFAFLTVSATVHAVVIVGVSPPVQDVGLYLPASMEVSILPPQPLPAAPAEAAPQRPSQRRTTETAPSTLARRQPIPVGVPALVPAEEDAQSAIPSQSETPLFQRAEKSREAGTEIATLNVTPAYLRNPGPRYPDAARRAGEQGTVTLRVLVTREGLPARVTVEKSSGSAHLDTAALEAVKAWRFTPARQGAERIESWMLVPVVFRLEGAS